MLFVVVDELVPKMHEGKFKLAPTFAVLVGFVVMMFLDATLG